MTNGSCRAVLDPRTEPVPVAQPSPGCYSGDLELNPVLLLPECLPSERCRWFEIRYQPRADIRVDVLTSCEICFLVVAQAIVHAARQASFQ
jgi:hypothetical protein